MTSPICTWQCPQDKIIRECTKLFETLCFSMLREFDLIWSFLGYITFYWSFLFFIFKEVSVIFLVRSNIQVKKRELDEKQYPSGQWASSAREKGQSHGNGAVDIYYFLSRNGRIWLDVGLILYIVAFFFYFPCSLHGQFWYRPLCYSHLYPLLSLK